MKKIVFKMLLNKGLAEEYKKRHDNIWPELKKLLLDSGIYDYSIYLEQKSYSLFAIMYVKDNYQIDSLSQNKIVRKWWDYMSDIMETAVDNSPVIYHLEEVFNLKKHDDIFTSSIVKGS